MKMCCPLKLGAGQNSQTGRIRPAGRSLPTPGLDNELSKYIISDRYRDNLNTEILTFGNEFYVAEIFYLLLF